MKKLKKYEKNFLKINAAIICFGLGRGYLNNNYTFITQDKPIYKEVNNFYENLKVVNEEEYNKEKEEFNSSIEKESIKSQDNQEKKVDNKEITKEVEEKPIKKIPKFNSTSNSKFLRQKILNKLKTEEFDVLVIGGGSVGSGTAYAASSRGMKVGVIEKYDFSSGTSSKSTKIAHGGIRYLEEALNLKSPKEKLYLLYEALQERDRIISSGPFINHTIEMRIGTNNPLEAVYLFMGTMVYHMIYRISLFPNQAYIPFPAIHTNFRKNFTQFLNNANFYKEFNNKFNQKEQKETETDKETKKQEENNNNNKDTVKENIKYKENQQQKIKDLTPKEKKTKKEDKKSIDVESIKEKIKKERESISILEEDLSNLTYYQRVEKYANYTKNKILEYGSKAKRTYKEEYKGHIKDQIKEKYNEVITEPIAKKGKYLSEISIKKPIIEAKEGIVNFFSFLATDRKIAFESINHKLFEIALFEGQMIDSRQNMLTLLSNRLKETDSSISNYIEFKEYIYDQENKIIGVKCEDTISKEKFDIKSKIVCNCTGIFGDMNLEKDNKFKNTIIKASRGTHILVNPKAIPFLENSSHGLIIPKTSDGRILFILPYQGKILIGTTDKVCEKSEMNLPSQEEIDFLVKEVCSNYLIKEDFFRDNITSAFAGSRPLVLKNPEDLKNNGGEVNKKVSSTKEISRKHLIYHNKESNLYSIFGGKWTTYLRMGEDIVNEVLKNNPELREKSVLFRKDKNQSIQKRASDERTYVNIKSYDRKLDLEGSLNNFYYGNIKDDYKKNPNLSFERDVQVDYYKEKQFFYHFVDVLRFNFPYVDRGYIRDLVIFYGVNAAKILQIGEKDGTNIPLDFDLSMEQEYLLKSEIDYCIKYEQIQKPNDFLLRRRTLGFIDKESSRDYIAPVAIRMGMKYGWSDEKIEKEIEESIKNLEYMF